METGKYIQRHSADRIRKMLLAAGLGEQPARLKGRAFYFEANKLDAQYTDDCELPYYDVYGEIVGVIVAHEEQPELQVWVSVPKISFFNLHYLAFAEERGWVAHLFTIGADGDENEASMEGTFSLTD